jgi:hypothetical protein
MTTETLAPLKTNKQDSAAVRAHHSNQNNLNILTPISSSLGNQLYTAKNVVAGSKHLRGSSVDAVGNVTDMRNK